MTRPIYSIPLLCSFALAMAACTSDATLDHESAEDPESPPVTGTAFLRFGRNGAPQHVPYIVVHGLAIAQGDILLGRTADIGAESARLQREIEGDDEPASAMGIRSGPSLWKNGLVTFALDASLTLLQRIEIDAAMAHWEQSTSIRFKEQSSCNPVGSCVVFKRSTDDRCNSFVGALHVLGVALRQDINVADWCLRGNLIHEIGHAVGLYHEHTRSDRDNFITVETSNFSADPAQSHCASQFTKETDKKKNVGSYDFSSIMHYARFSSCSGKDANGALLPLFTYALPVPPGTTVGQRLALSPGDLAAIADMYGSTANDHAEEE